jgi:hypothetical protein
LQVFRKNCLLAGSCRFLEKIEKKITIIPKQAVGTLPLTMSLSDVTVPSSISAPFTGGAKPQKTGGTKLLNCEAELSDMCKTTTYLSSGCCVGCHMLMLTDSKHQGKTATGQSTNDIESEVYDTLRDKTIIGKSRSDLVNFYRMLRDINTKIAEFDPIIESHCHCDSDSVHRRTDECGISAHTLTCGTCGHFCSNCTNDAHIFDATEDRDAIKKSCKQYSDLIILHDDPFIKGWRATLLKDHDAYAASIRAEHNLQLTAKVMQSTDMRCCPWTTWESARRAEDHLIKSNYLTQENALTYQHTKETYHNVACQADPVCKTDCDDMRCGEHSSDKMDWAHQNRVHFDSRFGSNTTDFQTRTCGKKAYWEFWVPFVAPEPVAQKPPPLDVVTYGTATWKVAPLYTCSICNQRQRCVSATCTKSTCEHRYRKVCGQCLIDYCKSGDSYTITTFTIIDPSSDNIITFSSSKDDTTLRGTVQGSPAHFHFDSPYNEWYIAQTSVGSTRIGHFHFRRNSRTSATMHQPISAQDTGVTVCIDSANLSYAQCIIQDITRTDDVRPHYAVLRTFNCLSEGHIMEFDGMTAFKSQLVPNTARHCIIKFLKYCKRKRMFGLLAIHAKKIVVITRNNLAQCTIACMFRSARARAITRKHRAQCTIARVMFRRVHIRNMARAIKRTYDAYASARYIPVRTMRMEWIIVMAAHKVNNCTKCACHYYQSQGDHSMCIDCHKKHLKKWSDKYCATCKHRFTVPRKKSHYKYCQFCVHEHYSKQNAERRAASARREAAQTAHVQAVHDKNPSTGNWSRVTKRAQTKHAQKPNCPCCRSNRNIQRSRKLQGMAVCTACSGLTFEF